MGFQYLPRRARRIVVSGSLAAFAGDLRRDLAGRGYTLDTVTDHVHRLADLSGWLAGRGLTAADLTGEVSGQFPRDRRAAGVRTGLSARAFAPVLGYLREVGAAPPPGPPVLVSAVDALLVEYKRYLEVERSLSAGTVRHYLRYGRAFLDELPGPLGQALAGLSAGQVTGHVLGRARRRRDGVPQDMVVLPARRSLLRFLHIAGYTGLPLAGAVPAGRSWKPGLPRAASADDLQAVLAACDRDSAGGRRDYAIVLAMTRLALRGGEVARYLASVDPACQIPPADLLPAPSHRPPPYIYSGEEIAALIHAAGTIGAAQLGVFLAYAGPKGRALIDRELYLPRSWAGDEDRLAAAKVPDGTPFRTKPQRQWKIYAAAGRFGGVAAVNGAGHPGGCTQVTFRSGSAADCPSRPGTTCFIWHGCMDSAAMLGGGAWTSAWSVWVPPGTRVSRCGSYPRACVRK